jgi:tRNA G18 (ribose-2'-O)-methylase SpoU
VRVVRVTDAGDPRLSDYRDLRDVALRRLLETDNGLFIAEGAMVLRRAIAAGYQPRSVLVTQQWLDGLADVLAATDMPCYLVDEAVAEQVAGFHVHRGALAAMHRRPLPAVADVLAGADRVIVLEDVVDHTNIGAILRSAVALGAGGALLSPRCADPLYRRAVKVSMGTVFSLPWTRVDDWWEAVPELRRAGFVTVALTPAPDAVDLADVPTDGRLALLVGSEGPGLSRRWQQAADVRARIPMAGGIDSLNVAAAVAVACYALRRRESR